MSEVPDSCMYCLSTKELSIKTRRSNGVCIFMCRSCRREKYHGQQHKPITIKEEIQWRKESKASLERILAGNYQHIIVRHAL